MAVDFAQRVSVPARRSRRGRARLRTLARNRSDRRRCVPQPIWRGAMNPKSTSESETTQIACAFCGGLGTDPFGIMSPLSTCGVCGGRRIKQVPVPHIRCAHCDGRGSVKTFSCTVCGGCGVLRTLEGPTACCPDCRGSGDDRSAPALECLTCHGRGLIPAEE